ncbi:MAG: hypothetical protein WCO92_01270 [Verrucomicrobiota bacterium]
MNIKKLSLHLLILSMVLTSYSFAQSSTSYSSIPSCSSPQEDKSLSSTIAPQELNVDLSATKNYSIKVKAGEALALSINNPDKLYHSGELDNLDLYNELDLRHTLCTSLYSDSWNPLNHNFSLEKENNLNQETGDSLVYHFNAVRPGNTYIYFCTHHKKSSKYGPLLMPDWIGPKITVEVSQ